MEFLMKIKDSAMKRLFPDDSNFFTPIVYVQDEGDFEADYEEYHNEEKSIIKVSNYNIAKDIHNIIKNGEFVSVLTADELEDISKNGANKYLWKLQGPENRKLFDKVMDEEILDCAKHFKCDIKDIQEVFEYIEYTTGKDPERGQITKVLFSIDEFIEHLYIEGEIPYSPFNDIDKIIEHFTEKENNYFKVGNKFFALEI